MERKDVVKPDGWGEAVFLFLMRTKAHGIYQRWARAFSCPLVPDPPDFSVSFCWFSAMTHPHGSK